jgi:hypothetical protein
MAFLMDDVCSGGQFMVGEGQPVALGIGPNKIRGSGYVEAPLIVGDPNAFSQIAGTLMVATVKNEDSPTPVVGGASCGINYSPYAFVVSGDAAIFDNLSVNGNVVTGGNLICQGNVVSQCGGHVLSAKKNFDIPHPSKEGWRLRHTCPEGPSNDVYFRGRVTNRTEIEFPTYWKNFVDTQSVTVLLTPIGAHQDVIVKRIDEKKVYLQSKGGMPIDCFYQIFAERIDGERLIPEYQGETPKDYPGNNDEYSIVGYNYDRR